MIGLLTVLLVGASEVEPASTSTSTELGVLPAVNYSSDTGLGFGVLAALARFDPERRPFDWRVELLLYATLKEIDGSYELPVHADYIKLDKPAFLGERRLRFNGEIGFRKQSNARWFGLGSESSEAPPGADGRYNLYDRIFPGLSASLRYALVDRPVPIGKWRLEVFGRLAFTYNVISSYSGSRLEADLATEALALRGRDHHALLIGAAGLLFDTRDHEFIPSSGWFAELSFRGSPGLDQELVFGGGYLSIARYLALGSPHFVLATRLAADLLFGKVPFYELAVMGGLLPYGAPGGGLGVRGVLAGRFAGHTKGLGSLELRAHGWRVGTVGAPIDLGVVGFVDAGRVWDERGDNADFPALEVGVGGGLRIQWGQTFLIRLDTAYAPTVDSFGLYFDIGQAF